ncbi:inositol monophosphatase family protein [Dethiosulfatarculus sandiegensis]|uniref:Inositol-1-monophosphatase n=1 Tax=Dethiosulfatarculus sandiegensis TaxID=1429043 RepID=A0A0D2J0V3_9BACT|nr:inositol monophosphatase family protein [Dethiosulfatarculus sandiegensis]KIX11879.1 inositol monophosphatase [Dethiosulfatarculus sandiegensis]
MSAELLNTARKAARAGADVLRSMWNQKLTVENKAKFDFVTQADKASEKAVLKVITDNHPDHRILAEESAHEKPRDADQGVLWIVDPLDGTNNFIHHIPHISVSVAACRDGRPVAGVVLDVTRDEEFYALAGKGAWLNDRPIKVTDCAQKEKSVLLTGFPFRVKSKLDDYLALFKTLFLEVSGMRRAGSAALDLAYVAAGRAEGFWEIGLEPWDVAAGMLLVEEAGGKVTDFSGRDRALWNREMVAANQPLHSWLQENCNRFLVS